MMHQQRAALLARAQDRIAAGARRYAGQEGMQAPGGCAVPAFNAFGAGMPGQPSPYACPPGHMPYICAPCRVYGLPIDSGVVIGIGVTLQLPAASPQKPFLGQLLIIPSTFAPFFVLNSFFVGTNNQMVANGAQPCEPYSEVSVNNILNLDPAGPGVDIILTVTNIGGAVPLERRFRATLFGTAIPS